MQIAKGDLLYRQVLVTHFFFHFVFMIIDHNLFIFGFFSSQLRFIIGYKYKKGKRGKECMHRSMDGKDNGLFIGVNESYKPWTNRKIRIRLRGILTWTWNYHTGCKSVLILLMMILCCSKAFTSWNEISTTSTRFL